MSAMSLLVTWMNEDSSQFELGGLDAESWECYRIFDSIEEKDGPAIFFIYLLDSDGYILSVKSLTEHTIRQLFPETTTEELIASGVEIDIEFIPEPNKEQEH